jgi:hypothetical protein
MEAFDHWHRYKEGTIDWRLVTELLADLPGL